MGEKSLRFRYYLRWSGTLDFDDDILDTIVFHAPPSILDPLRQIDPKPGVGIDRDAGRDLFALGVQREVTSPESPCVAPTAIGLTPLATSAEEELRLSRPCGAHDLHVSFALAGARRTSRRLLVTPRNVSLPANLA